MEDAIVWMLKFTALCLGGLMSLASLLLVLATTRWLVRSALRDRRRRVVRDEFTW